MVGTGDTLRLTGAHVIDPSQGIDRVTDVVIGNGKVKSVGDAPPASADEAVLDLSGHYLTPGWIDIHVHAYGTLGFADPDSIGIYQGVTSFVEAGGPGIGTLDEFLALMTGRTRTSLYVGPYIRPMGIVGLSYIEGDVRTLMDVPIAQWIDVAKEHRELLRYLKIGAFADYGTGPLKLGKGLAEILDLPIYVHIGEFQVKPNKPPAIDIFQVADSGDIITHIYHNNIGRILDEDGKVLPVVREAERRGVLFDIGFGGYNFSWAVAESAYRQDLVPHLISSDLQQFNVLGPVYSLANVLSVFLRLGLPLADIIARVTANPARALSLRAGSLRKGMPADITVFRLEEGDFDLSDCHSQTRKSDKRISPIIAFKDGQRIDCDVMRCQDERNWFMQVSEDRIPEAARNFSRQQLDFVGSLSKELADIDWKISSAQNLDLEKASVLQQAFHRAKAQHDLTLKEALMAVYGSFLENPFTVQSGLFLMRLERPFALERLKDVAGQSHLAA